jgi:hypothetical protein
MRAQRPSVRRIKLVENSVAQAICADGIPLRALSFGLGELSLRC